MRKKLFTFVFPLALTFLFVSAWTLKSAFAQDDVDNTITEEPGDEEIIPQLPPPGGERFPVTPAGERVEGGAPREGETRWNVTITGAVIVNYVFNEEASNFTVKYRWEVKGQANAETAVIHGDAEFNAEVAGPLSKWPTGECKLEITVPKVPFELTFRRSNEQKGSMKLVFKRAITEDWQSKCTFTDAPNAKFDTRGSPETWLTKAMDKARPPLRDIIADMGTEEKTTRFVINKEIIPDPPLGSAEIEGTGVITIKPGGAE
ncbi:MAG: hypothetical protein V2A66_05495 [Pseudomonadota bacterium]